MFSRMKLALGFVLLALVFGFQLSGSAQESTNHEVKTLETGTFHGKVHPTSGRATIYRDTDGKLVLRLTNFKTSNGPDVLSGAVGQFLIKDVVLLGAAIWSLGEALNTGNTHGCFS